MLQKEIKTAYSYVLEVMTKLKDTCKLAHDCLEEAKKVYRHYYDRKSSKTTLREADKKDTYFLHGQMGMARQWKKAFVNTAKKNDVDYESDLDGRKRVFHVNMLKKNLKEKKMTLVSTPIVASEEEGTSTLSVNKKDGLKGLLTNKNLGDTKPGSSLFAW